MAADAPLVLDLDPPEGAAFDVVAADGAARARGARRRGAGGRDQDERLQGGARLRPGRAADGEAIAAATRALAARAAALDPSIATIAYVVEEREGKVFVDSTRAGGGTVAAAYSPRIRPGVPVSFPVRWDELEHISPADFTIRTAPDLLAGRDPWMESMPAPQALPEDLVEEGRAIPVARVAAMHEGKRRKRGS